MTLKISLHRRAFSLVELLVAMAITSLLVLIIMQLTNSGLDIWKNIREEVSTTSRARMALRSMSQDITAMRIRYNDNKYEWFCALEDDSASSSIKRFSMPNSIQCIFFTSADDRNPAVSSNDTLRSNYRNARARDIETQGDVNAVGYRLLFRDQILNLAGDNRKMRGAFPLYSLYRQLVSPRDAFEELLGRKDLELAYQPFIRMDEENFLCENIVEMNMIINVEYAGANANASDNRVEYEQIKIPVLNSRTRNAKFSVYGDRIEYKGKIYENARMTSVDISLTVVTEEGMNLINQIRLGRRAAPSQADFFRRFTRSFAHRVTPPTN